VIAQRMTAQNAETASPVEAVDIEMQVELLHDCRRKDLPTWRR
jgi:hypothetical protein